MHDEAMAAARALAERQHWLISAERLRALGVGRNAVERCLRKGEWRSLLHGVYLVDADMYDEMPASMIWRAALMKHGPDSMLVGRTGARALGIQGLPPLDDVVEVALLDGVSRARQASDVPGDHRDEGPVVVVRQFPVPRDQVVIVDGMRVRRAPETVVDAALQLDRVHALCVIDSSLHLKLLTTDEFERAVAAATRRRGCLMLREVAARADGRAESPLETRIRLACIDGGLPPDDLQYEVEAEPGVTVAVGDLAWYRRRRRPLLGECDGVEPHSRPKPVFRDRRRGNSLTGLACDTVRFVWEDALRPAYVQYVVRNALAADGPLAS